MWEVSMGSSHNIIKLKKTKVIGNTYIEMAEKLYGIIYKS
jgi:hypothetical protein